MKTLSAKLKYVLIVILAACMPMVGAAVEGGVGFYLLGQRNTEVAVLPPPGLFLQFEEYLYNGEVSGSTAIAENGKLEIGVEADAAISLLTGIWAPTSEFAGGRPMVMLTLPFGYQKVSVDAEFSLGGIKLRDKFSENDFSYGDPILGLSLGWNQQNWHWTINSALNIPIGDYDKSRLTNIAFNRWGLDATGALSYIDPNTGWDFSLAAGFTFNGKNTDTDYDSGTEFHLEAAIAKSFSNGWKVGLVGYHYDQVSDDKGAGAPVGGNRGEVTALGPAVSYSLVIRGIPIALKGRWYHEFNAENRTEGDAIYVGFSMPLAVFE